jgi:hypothetical protein
VPELDLFGDAAPMPLGVSPTTDVENGWWFANSVEFVFTMVMDMRPSYTGQIASALQQKRARLNQATHDAP